MIAIGVHCVAHRMDRLDCTHGVSFNTGNLHETADRITCQSQIVLHPNFCCIFNLFICAAKCGGQSSCSHRCCHAHFSLASHLCCRKRGSFFVKNADRGSG